MAAELMWRMVSVNLALAGAITVILILGPMIRREFGPRLAYGAWLIVPMAAIGALIPGRPALDIVFPLPAPAAAGAGLSGGAGPAPLDVALLMLTLWGIGAAAGLIATFWTQARSVKLMGLLRTESPRLVRAANPAIGPAVFGLIRQKIVLPSDFEGRFSAREQTMILAHEESHLAAGDARINALVALIRCLCWFNPLVHLAAPRLRADQELACDARIVARFPRERRAYAEALLKAQALPTPLPLGCYWPARSPQRLKERLQMLSAEEPQATRRLVGAAIIALIGAGTGYAAWAAPEPQAAPTASAPAPSTATNATRRIALTTRADGAAPIGDMTQTRRVPLRANQVEAVPGGYRITMYKPAEAPARTGRMTVVECFDQGAGKPMLCRDVVGGR